MYDRRAAQLRHDSSLWFAAETIIKTEKLDTSATNLKHLLYVPLDSASQI